MMTVRSAAALALAAALPLQTMAQILPSSKPCADVPSAAPDIDGVLSVFRAARSEGASAPRAPLTIRAQAGGVLQRIQRPFDGAKPSKGIEAQDQPPAKVQGKPAGTPLERLLAQIESAGQVHKAPNGNAMKLVEPISEETETSQTIYGAAITGKVDDKGVFTKESLLVVRGYQETKQEKLPNGSTRAEQSGSQAAITAGLDGKVQKMTYLNQIHVDVVTTQEMTAAQAEAGYKAALAAVQKAFGAADVKALIEKTKSDGDINPFASPLVQVLQTETETLADGTKVKRASALELEVNNRSLQPTGLVVVEVTEKFADSTSGTVTTQKGPKVQTGYKAGLDGSLKGATKTTTEHSLVTDKGEKGPGDASAQKALDDIVKKLTK